MSPAGGGVGGRLDFFTASTTPLFMNTIFILHPYIWHTVHCIVINFTLLLYLLNHNALKSKHVNRLYAYLSLMRNFGNFQLGFKDDVVRV